MKISSKYLSLLIALLVLLCIMPYSYAVSVSSWDCSCGAKNNTGNFCPLCGSPSPVWECPNCKTVNSFNFCTNCGTEKPSENNTASGQEDTSVLQSDYFIATHLADTQDDYQTAIEIIEPLAKQHYLDSEDLLKEYKYKRALQLIARDAPENYMGACNILKELKSLNYYGASEKLEETYSKMLGKGKYAYYKSDFYSAKMYLDYLDNNHYNDESKLYYTLACVRSDEYYSKSMYRYLLNHIDEADVKEVLVCNQFAANWYLTGKWKSENGYRMQLGSNSTLEENIPSVIDGDKHYWVEDGRLYVYEKELQEKALDKELEVLDANTVKVYSYESEKSYIMTRAN